MERVKAAIVGCGARSDHLVSAAAEAGALEIAYACDRVADLAERKAAAWHCAAATDFREVFADSSVEAVIIATGVEAHLPIARAALESGKHVIVEKPLGDDIVAARELVRLAAKSGLVAYVNYQMRFQERMMELQAAARKIAPVQILFERQRGMMKPQFLNPRPFCGILDNASHDLDMVPWLMGAAPLAVTAVIQRDTWTKNTGAAETLSALVDFGGGRSATLVSSIGAAELQNRIDVVGVGGYLSLGHPRGDFGVMRGSSGSDSKQSEFTLPAAGKGNADAALQRAFAKEIRGEGASQAARPADGLNALLLTIGCLRSAEEGRRVELATLLMG